MAGKRREWWIRPGWGGSAGAFVSGTVSKYIVESDAKSFNMYFVGAGMGPRVGWDWLDEKAKNWSGSGASESMPSSGSPLHYHKALLRAYGNDVDRLLSGTGLVIEADGIAAVGVGVQILIFRYTGGPNPGCIAQVVGDCLTYTYGVDYGIPFQSTWMSAFGVVGGISAGPSLGAGLTFYYGHFE